MRSLDRESVPSNGGGRVIRDPASARPIGSPATVPHSLEISGQILAYHVGINTEGRRTSKSVPQSHLRLCSIDVGVTP